MKYIFIVICLAFSIQLEAQDNEYGNWLTDFEEAKKMSAEKKMPILMYFTGSDWCAPCKKLKKDFFDTPEFKEASKNTILVLVDRPYRMDVISEEQLAKNKVLIEKYNKKGTFPLLLALDKNGKVKDEMSGYSGDPRYYKEFVKRNS